MVGTGAGSGTFPAQRVISLCCHSPARRGTQIPVKPWQSQECRGRGWKGSEDPKLNLSGSWGHSAEWKSGKEMCWEGHFSSVPQPGMGEGKIKPREEYFHNTHRTGRDGVSWPWSPLQAGDTHVPRPPALLVTDELSRGGEAAGHLRWHHSTAGTLSGQQGSGARGDFADPGVFCRIWRKFDSNFRTQLQHEGTRGLCEPHLLPFEQKFKGSAVGVLREAEGSWVSQGKQKGLGMLLRAP